jgi:hypothetical protein
MKYSPMASSVMLPEVVFGLCCIVQCVVNTGARRFVGTDAACDIQAGSDEGLSSLSLSNLLYMENPYS